MYFSHISAKIQPKNLKQHFDWGEPSPLGLSWLRSWLGEGDFYSFFPKNTHFRHILVYSA